MSYYKQVELASGGKVNKDFELVDIGGDGNIVIRRLNPSFNIPTQAEIDAKETEAQTELANIASAKVSVKGKPSGNSPAQLNARLTNLERIVAELL